MMAATPDGPAHESCAETLRATAMQMPQAGGELDVIQDGPKPPDRAGYPPSGFTCPHGVHFWVMPSYRQISAWEGTS